MRFLRVMEIGVLASSLLAVYLLNIPLGYWRAGVRKFSKSWVLAVHLPVPLVFTLRFLIGAGWLHLPLFVAAFFLGQFSGGRIRRVMDGRARSLCLVMDLVRKYGSVKLEPLSPGSS